MHSTELFLKQDFITSDPPVLRYRLFSATQAVLIGWSELVLEQLAEWPSSSSPRLLFDLSHPNASMSYFVLSQRDLYNAGITPQGRTRLIAYLQADPQRHVKLGVLLSSTMLGALTSYKPRRIEQHNFNGKIFFEEMAALDWLQAAHTAADDAHQTNVITDRAHLRLDEPVPADDHDYYGEREDLRLLVNGSLEVIPIAENRPVIVGRGPDNDLDVSSHGEVARSVSRRHAQISLINGRLTIIDLDSLNGTRLSGRVLTAGEPTLIRRRDVIRLGNMKLTVLF